ncbi:MAG TPA: Panacea domain-containing protein [Longimicrobium sp.]|jgi:hypothetical protein|uniref:Panacea domain-containing protein n=1 Tax=Longimicrobium sp. TaxID=2029185 RepID=UPI002ED8E516
MGDNRKLAELILYISARCEDDAAYGSTKLNKILFYADFLFYANTGVSITGQEYMRLDRGPAPRRLVVIRNELVDQGALTVRDQSYGRWRQKRPVALRPVDLSAFTTDEIASVDSVVREFWGMSATEVSDHSHRFDGWKLANDRETIPYPTALISDEAPSAEDHAIALQLGREWAARRAA